MCYSIAQVMKARELEDRYAVNFPNAEFFQQSYFLSAFSHPMVPVVIGENNGLIQLFQWGLVPFWVKDTKAADEINLKTVNARSESVFEKPAYRDSVRMHRCLVPVSGFFEWREVERKKYPYYIWLRDEPCFSLAGIYSRWADPQTGEIRNTFSILTTVANPLLEQIHNTKKRMPVIIPRDREKLWINHGLGRDSVEEMLKPYSTAAMDAYPVTRAINRRGETAFGPETVREQAYPELAPLIKAS
jgi:putative SOS response-associated peptidase YedK